MGILIDTSLIIALERDATPIEKLVRGRKDEEVFISVISISELWHGVHRAKTVAIRQRRKAFVEAVIQAMPVLEIRTDTAEAHAKLWAYLAERGEMIGCHDSWIAAQCLTQQLSLATLNAKEFQRVPRLKLEKIIPEPKVGG